jgi:toxin YoeB
LTPFGLNTALAGGKRGDQARDKAPAASRKRLALLQQRFREDLQFWILNNPRVASRLLDLMDECLRTPFTGTGKPEALKNLGAWPRRLTDADRIVYVVRDDEVEFLQARFHYDD